MIRVKIKNSKISAIKSQGVGAVSYFYFHRNWEERTFQSWVITAEVT